MSPALVLLGGERYLHKRPPFRPFRFADQCHARFVWQTVSFARVAGNTGANHVFPRRGTAFVTRQNVIQVQFAAVENLAAILAGVFVPLENIVPRKFHFLLRQPIEEQEDDDARHADFPRNGCDHFGFRSGFGKVQPAVEIVREKIVFRIGRNNLSVSLVNQSKGAAGGANIDRLPETIQHQNLTV